MRCVVGLLLLTAAVGADPDGAIAEPTRWTGPHGPASNSRRSRALAVTRDVVEAWATKLPGVSVAPPVTWDGTIYALCAARKGHILCGIDLRTGKLKAKKQLPKAPAGELHTWGRNVFVQSSDRQLSAFRMAGGSFIQSWKCNDIDPQSVRVYESEIYARSGHSIVRLSLAESKPIWSATDDYIGPLAIYGNYIFCQSGGQDDSKIAALRRRDGSQAARKLVAWIDGDSPMSAQLMVGPNQILLSPGSSFRTQGGSATHAFVPVTHSTRGAPRIGKCDGLSSFGTWPAACRDGVITMEAGRTWMWWTKKGGAVLAERKWTPDLFVDRVAPTVVGDVAYFGKWAADIVTGEILWRLPVRGVKHPPVPADKLIVIVDLKDTMRGYRER